MSPGPGVITCHLREWRSGDPEALTRLTSAIYTELRRLAAAILNSRSGLETIQPTELVHELYLELPGLQELDIESRAHFLNLSARVMRQILIDHARKRMAARRGGQPVTLRMDSGVTDQALDVDVLLVDEVLERFAEKYPRQAEVVELRFFGGLTAQETADAMSASGAVTSLRAVERDWTFAKAWLHHAIATR
jgi:RNA polymerase sigma factor (TIGR02999 family)